MAFDPAPWRADTVAVTRGRIHLNNAGASLMPAPVAAAVHDHLRREEEVGGYEAADAERERIEQAYAEVAALLGTRARNVAMVENATVAFAQALAAFDFAPGDVILTSDDDYASNQLMYLSLARRAGVEVVRASTAPAGGVDLDSVRELVTARRPRLVALTWIPTNAGLVQPAAAVGRICREAEVPYLLDACQAVGQIHIDVAALGCDFLAATARKFLRGPRGAGFLYVADGMLDAGRHPLLVDMRGADWVAADRFELRPDARRFENWEFAYALVLGTGAAAAYARRVGVSAGGAHARALAERLREGLAGIEGVRVLDRGAELCAIVTCALDGLAAGRVVEVLRREAIATSALDPVSAVIDMARKGASSALRISPHYFNTEREVDTVLGSIEAIVAEERGG